MSTSHVPRRVASASAIAAASAGLSNASLPGVRPAAAPGPTTAATTMYCAASGITADVFEYRRMEMGRLYSADMLASQLARSGPATESSILNAAT
jgi:hypothetical protein